MPTVDLTPRRPLAGWRDTASDKTRHCGPEMDEYDYTNHIASPGAIAAGWAVFAVVLLTLWLV